MKKLIVAALLVLTQLSHAQVREVTRMTTEQARARVERSTTFQDIVKAREAGKDITADAKLMERVNKMLDLSLRDLVSFTATENNNLIKLMNVNAKDILTEVARLSSVAKDSASTAQEKQMAKKSLELISKASHDVESLAVNSSEAQKQQEKVAKIIEISGKISALDFGQSSKTFVEKYEKALTEGKSVADAIKIASNGKFTEKELRECE
ncbi:MAG: hypothetical protein ABL930_06880 [Pseudobdellovibrio sp.]